MRVALGAAVDGEVKYIPDERAPKPRAGLDLQPVFLVEFRLPLLRMPRAFGLVIADGWIFLVLVNARARAIFADTETALRIINVKFVQPLAEVGIIAAIPAEILVHTEDVGAEIARVVGQVVRGVSGEARRVFLVRDGVKLDQKAVGELRRRVVGLAGGLIANAPEKYRRMVEVLADEFAQLLLGVGATGVGFRRTVDKAQFRPHRHAASIAKVVEKLVVLVMTQPHRVHAHLAHDGKVLAHIGLGNRPTLVQPVLMPVNAMQRHMLAVQEKSCVRLHLEMTQTQGLLDGVHRAAIVCTAKLSSR